MNQHSYYLTTMINLSEADKLIVFLLLQCNYCFKVTLLSGHLSFKAKQVLFTYEHIISWFPLRNSTYTVTLIYF